MKIKLVFEDWRKNEKSVYDTPEGIDLSTGPGQFHSGTIFDAEIDLEIDVVAELQKALDDGFSPVFYMIPKKQRN